MDALGTCHAGPPEERGHASDLRTFTIFIVISVINIKITFYIFQAFLFLRTGQSKICERSNVMIMQ